MKMSKNNNFQFFAKKSPTKCQWKIQTNQCLCRPYRSQNYPKFQILDSLWSIFPSTPERINSFFFISSDIRILRFGNDFINIGMHCVHTVLMPMNYITIFPNVQWLHHFQMIIITNVAAKEFEFRRFGICSITIVSPRFPKKNVFTNTLWDI